MDTELSAIPAMDWTPICSKPGTVGWFVQQAPGFLPSFQHRAQGSEHLL